MRDLANRAIVIGGLTLLLSACGFRPLYGSYGANPGAQAIFASIYVEPIALEDTGYELRNSLIDLLEARAAPQNATYRLEVTLQEHLQGAAVQNQIVTGVNETIIPRYNYTLSAEYQLLDSHGAVVTKGAASTLSGYNVVTSPYATEVAEEYAKRRATQDIAARVRTDLGVYFARRVGPAK